MGDCNVLLHLWIGVRSSPGKGRQNSVVRCTILESGRVVSTGDEEIGYYVLSVHESNFDYSVSSTRFLEPTKIFDCFVCPSLSGSEVAAGVAATYTGGAVALASERLPSLAPKF